MIVVGLGYGDEGKGLTTSYLCSKVDKPLVVRFNGGHQAGHTVVDGTGHRHVFSSFGSGTLQGVPTYWTQFCTVHPVALMHEYEKLKQFDPVLIVHPLCPLTTPWDVMQNRQRHEVLKHGTIGTGFGATLERQEEHYKLHVQDAYYPKIFAQKLKNIAKYYHIHKVDDDALDYYLKAVEKMKEIIVVEDENILVANKKSLIFEGAQGIMLDQDYGFFPNVTRSYTTSRNARELDLSLRLGVKSVYYVTRCYQTRHGNGYMSDERDLGLINNEDETNVTNEYQGDFRTGELDLDQIAYALHCDSHYSQDLERNLVITCMDQRKWSLDNIKEVFKKAHLDKLFISTGPNLADIKEIEIS